MSSAVDWLDKVLQPFPLFFLAHVAGALWFVPMPWGIVVGAMYLLALAAVLTQEEKCGHEHRP